MFAQCESEDVKIVPLCNMEAAITVAILCSEEFFSNCQGSELSLHSFQDSFHMEYIIRPKSDGRKTGLRL